MVNCYSARIASIAIAYSELSVLAVDIARIRARCHVVVIGRHIAKRLRESLVDITQRLAAAAGDKHPKHQNE